MGCGGTAKMVCSGTFIEGRALDEIRQHEVGLMPSWLFQVEIGENFVRASALGGLFARTADYGGPLVGCSLDDPTTGSTAQMERYASLGLSKSGAEEQPWPIGYVMSTSDIAEAQSAFDMDSLQSFVHKEFLNDTLNTRGVVVSHNGQIVYEEYGDSEEVGHFDENTAQLGWSMTKSLLSALIGKRIEDGALSLDEEVTWKGKDPLPRVTVRDLLQMSSGLEFMETYGIVNDPALMIFTSEDTAAYASDKPHIHAPGEVWSYASGSSNILSRKLKETFATEEEYLRYPREVLFDPLGMDSAVMEMDPSGLFVASSFSYATPRDWCKFGLLYLNHGSWPFGAEKQQQLLPSSWVDLTAQPAPASNGLYSLHWWLGGSAADRSVMPERLHWFYDLPEGSMVCSGYAGQIVVVVPSHNLVIVRMGYSPKSVGWNAAHFVAGIVAAMK